MSKCSDGSEISVRLTDSNQKNPDLMQTLKSKCTQELLSVDHGVVLYLRQIREKQLQSFEMNEAVSEAWK